MTLLKTYTNYIRHLSLMMMDVAITSHTSIATDLLDIRLGNIHNLTNWHIYWTDIETRILQSKCA